MGDSELLHIGPIVAVGNDGTDADGEDVQQQMPFFPVEAEVAYFGETIKQGLCCRCHFLGLHG